MNKTISIIRIVILLALSTFAVLFLLGEEDANCSLFQILIDKGLALAAFWYVGRLYKRWAKCDKWIRAYDKWCDDVKESPNPCYLGKD